MLWIILIVLLSVLFLYGCYAWVSLILNRRIIKSFSANINPIESMADYKYTYKNIKDTK